MYIVISKWKSKDGNVDRITELGKPLRKLLRTQPGVRMIETVIEGDTAHVIHVYDDEAAYQKHLNDPNSAFNKAMQESGIENHAEWLGSVRGEAVPD